MTVPGERLSRRESDSARYDRAEGHDTKRSRVAGPALRSIGVLRLPEWTPVAATVVGIVVVSVVAALSIGMVGATVYGARVDIFYASPEGTPDDGRERNLATQRELIRSRFILGDVASAQGIPLQELQESVTVEVGRDDIIRLTVANEDPQQARTLAQAISSRYIERARLLTPETDRGQRLIQDEIDRLSAGDAPPTDATRERIARLQDRLLELEVESATQAKATLLAPAYLLDKPLSPDPVRLVAIGLIVGSLIATATAAAMLRQRFTSRR